MTQEQWAEYLDYQLRLQAMPNIERYLFLKRAFEQGDSKPGDLLSLDGNPA